jgi:hypothetical protein
MKARNHYIYITLAALECYRENAGGLEWLASVAVPRNLVAERDTLDEQLRQFGAHLERYPHDCYFVITDTQAEAYQAELVPLLSGRDLRLLLARKLEQRYRSTGYRAVVPHRARSYSFLRNLSRRGSRSTTRILYALVNPETLSPWLGALEQRSLNVGGLYSLGALMPALVRHLNLPAGADALVVLRTAAGYRHAFVAPSGLRFSRLCVRSSAGDSQVTQEIDKTLQYLTMARLWGVGIRQRALHIAVIDAEPAAADLTVRGNNPLIVQPVQFRPRDLVARGPAKLLDAPNSAWLLFNGAALRAHGLGCASGLSLQDAGRRATYRRAAMGATAALALVTAGYVALTEAATRESSEHASTAELIGQHVDANAASSERATPKTELEAEQLRAVVQTRDRLLARSIDATGLLQATAAALAPFPDLDVDVLEWSYLASAPGADAAAPPTDAAAPSSAKGIVVHLGGHVDSTLLKAEANAAVVRLAAALAQRLHGAESIEKLPFDVGPGETLTSRPHDPALEKPQFSVTVTVPDSKRTAAL